MERDHEIKVKKKMGKGRAPCCDKSQVKRGPWSPAEDLRLISFIQKNGHENWRSLPKQAGLLRCGKSCRLRWINYLRPDVKRGNFTKEEEDTIFKLHDTFGNKWSKIASCLPGRTDNEIKNVWNTHLKKKLLENNKEAKSHDHDDESKESPSTTSSLSITSNHNSREKRRAESELNDGEEDRLDQRHVPKKPRESCHDHVAVESNESMIKDMSRTCSFSSNNSSSVTNLGQVDDHDHDATTIRSEEDDRQMGSFFEFSESYDFGMMNTLEEVNKPEIFIPDNNNIKGTEIPLDSDSDFWNMLDGLAESFQFNSVQSLEEDGFDNNNKEEVENQDKWFQYLENELGLEATEGHDQNQETNSSIESEPLIIPAETYEILLKPEVDIGMSNFQLWPPSPPLLLPPQPSPQSSLL
ncbi:hypothetical protein ACOSQ3_028215 [Xanthoceras sorbifolium]